MQRTTQHLDARQYETLNTSGLVLLSGPTMLYPYLSGNYNNLQPLREIAFVKVQSLAFQSTIIYLVQGRLDLQQREELHLQIRSPKVKKHRLNKFTEPKSLL
jgi:hypothetical protein